MGIDYRPALFLSVRGVKRTVNTKLVSIDDLDTMDNLPFSITKDVMSALLRYASLEIRASIKGKIEIINITEMEYIRNFILKGELEFLKEMNEMAFLDLCDKLNALKEKVLILSRSESKIQSENIRLLSETIHNYEEFRYEYVEWFFSKHIEVPIIQKQNNSIEIASEKVILGIHDNTIVPISHFDTLEILIPEHLDPNGKVSIRLEGEIYQTKLLELTRVEASFLMYLAMERNENGNMWLLNPENHIDELRQINKRFVLPIRYDTAILEELEGINTWFNDHKNKHRKTISSDINKIVRNNGSVKGRLIDIFRNVSPSRNGVYTLVKSITIIK